jgi:hypothetical protein
VVAELLELGLSIGQRQLAGLDLLLQGLRHAHQ